MAAFEARQYYGEEADYRLLSKEGHKKTAAYYHQPWVNAAVFIF